jgi:hypothetical protein
MSHEALSPQQFMYHISYPTNRESIQRQGLRKGVGDAVFMSTEPLKSHTGVDVWKVHTQGLKLHRDPGFETVEGDLALAQTEKQGWKSYKTHDPVKSSRLSLVAEGRRPRSEDYE